jgi:hypothetical protein
VINNFALGAQPADFGEVAGDCAAYVKLEKKTIDGIAIPPCTFCHVYVSLKNSKLNGVNFPAPTG